MKRKTAYSTAVILLISRAVLAQADLSDSSVYAEAVKNTIDSYYKNIGENSHLYNGSEYVPPAPKSNSDVFFMSSFVSAGSVFYDGTQYDNVPIAFDIFRGLVFTQRYKQHFYLQLVNDKVEWFSLLNHTFVRIVRDSLNDVPETGYYDRLYHGSTTVLAQRHKVVAETISTSVSNSQYVEQDRYFIKKNGVYYPVHNKKTVLRVYNDERKGLQKLLRKNKIKFKPNPEYGIISAAKYYDQLKK